MVEQSSTPATTPGGGSHDDNDGPGGKSSSKTNGGGEGGGGIVAGTFEENMLQSSQTHDDDIILSPSYISSASEYDNNDHDDNIQNDDDDDSGENRLLLGVVPSIEFPTSAATNDTNDQQQSSGDVQQQQQQQQQQQLLLPPSPLQTPGSGTNPTQKKETINPSSSPSPPSGGSISSSQSKANSSIYNNATRKNPPPYQPNLPQSPSTSGRGPGSSSSASTSLLPPRRTDATTTTLVGDDELSSNESTTNTPTTTTPMIKMPPSSGSVSASTSTTSQNTTGAAATTPTNSNSGSNGSASGINGPNYFLRHLQHQQLNPYDSDGSNASLVFSSSQAPSPQQQQQQQPRRGSGSGYSSSSTKPPTGTPSGSSSSTPSRGGGGPGIMPLKRREPPLSATTPAANDNDNSGNGSDAAGGFSSSSLSVPAAAGGRERLNSTDSFQSTGSIRYVMSQSPSDHAKGGRVEGTMTGRPGNSAALGTAARNSSGGIGSSSSSKISEPSPPRVLPYHERRKLLQQKQQQQQQQPLPHPNLQQPRVQPFPMDASQQEQIYLQQQQQQQQQLMMPNIEQQQIQIQQAAAAAQAQAAYFTQLQAFAQAQAQAQAHSPQSHAEQQQKELQRPSSPQPTPTMFPPFMDPQMMAAYYHQLAYGGGMPPPQYSPAVPGMVPPQYSYQAPLPTNSQFQDTQSQQQQMMNPMMTMMNQVPFHMMSPDQQRQMHEYQQQQQQQQQLLHFAAYQQQQMYQQMSSSSSSMQGDPMGVLGQNNTRVPIYSYPPQTDEVGTDQTHGQPPPGPESRPHRHKRSDSTGVPLLYSSNMPLDQLRQIDGPPSSPNQEVGTRYPSATQQSSETTPIMTNVKTLKDNPPLVQASNARPDSFSSGGSNSSNPPPPPPLSTTTRPPIGHARSHSGISHSQSDSFGSISSLGSSDRHHRTGSFSRDLQIASTEEAIDKDGQGQSRKTRHQDHPDPNMATIDTPRTPDEPEDRKVASSNTTAATTVKIDSATTPEAIREAVTHTRQNSFLNMLRLGWSPQSQAKERKTPDVNDFHRQNQEFLQSRQNRTQAMMVVPPFPSSAESPHHRRLGSQDHPPPSRGTHRRLSSIPQAPDGWDDGEDSSSVDPPSDDAGMKPKASGSSSRLKRPPPPPPPPPTNTGPRSIDQSPSYDTNETGSTPDSRLRYSDDEDDDNRPQNSVGYGGTHLDADYSEDDNDADEKTSLLPAAGISSNEQDEKYRGLRGDRPKTDYGLKASVARPYNGSYIPSPSPRSEWSSDSSRPLSPNDGSTYTNKWDDRTAKMMFEAAQKNKKSRKKKYRRRSAHKATVQKGIEDEEDDDSDEEDSDMDYRAWTMKRANMLEKERSKMIEQWKQEARAEAEMFRREAEAKEPHRRCWASFARVFMDVGDKSFRCLTRVEIFIANLPLTIGAVAMAVVTLGVVWFKFAEEFLSTCEAVHFHSSQCNFPEFPGCFYCDQTVLGYKIALSFHYGCKLIAGFLAMLVVAKILLATRVVMDEMSSPTTSSPAGLLCMTTCVVFAGRGVVGQVLVSAAACGHLCLVMWFIYMALAYRIMPEPSWFPNTIGIGLSAVKTWLYYPTAGHLLMAISLLLNFFFFPISLIRVAANKKISATVGWMQMGAPAISLYSLTIIAQPSFEEEHPDVTSFQMVHRMVYLPCMHAMMALTIIGMGASVHSLSVRWADFSKRKFSPAHAAFAFPTLSHANAVQAYRGAVMSFAGIPSRTWPFFILDVYWLVVLIGGTVATLWICGKFLYHLPEWTAPDLMDEEEPPAPYETLLSQKEMVTVGDHLTQPYVSAAIIQANETGALIMARNRRDGTTRYVRTRRVGALGFEPTMNWSEMQEEAEVLLEYVGKNPPRRRHRTLSVPGIDFSYGASAQPFGTGNVGVYGTMSSDQQAHNRNMTLGANDTRILF